MQRAEPMGNLGMEMAGPFTVSLNVDPSPARPGRATITAEVRYMAKPVPDAKVTFRVFKPLSGANPLPIAAKHTSKNFYAANVSLAPGECKMEVAINDAAGKGTGTFKFHVH